MQNYSDQDYYWAKAEFQDSVAHRQHVENYKQGKPDCDYFHEQYKGEFKKSMDGIFTTSVSFDTIDEAPMAYKPMDEIVENIKDTVDILEIIKPVYNFKASEV